MKKPKRKNEKVDSIDTIRIEINGSGLDSFKKLDGEARHTTVRFWLGAGHWEYIDFSISENRKGRKEVLARAGYGLEILPKVTNCVSIRCIDE